MAIEMLRDCFIVVCLGLSMHVKWFVIKVWDLLRNPGKVDEIRFDNLTMQSFVDLTSGWVSGILLLQGINESTVRVTVQSLVAHVRDICDLSWEEFEREVVIEDKDLIYSSAIAVDEFDNNSLYDNLFPRDGVHESLDLEDGLRQLIEGEQPVVAIKPGNEYILDQFDSDDDESSYA